MQTAETNTRAKASLQNLKKFQKRYGERGKQVIRFEYANYKRILRGPSSSKWKPVKMSVNDFFARIYREDAHAELNWSNIAPKPPLPRPIIPEKAADSAEQLNNEYVSALVTPGGHYSIEREVHAPGDAAHPHVTETLHFRLIDVQTAHNRPHVTVTADSADDVENVAPLAWEIAREEPVPTVPTQDAAHDTTTVHFEQDSEWVRPWSLAPFEVFNKTLRVWKRSEPSGVMDACTELAIPERTRVRYGVLDDRCPVLAIVQHLKTEVGMASHVP